MQERGGRGKSGGRMDSVQKIRLIVGGLIIGCILSSQITVLAQSQVRSSHPVTVEDDGIPDDLQQIFEDVAADFELCPELLESMAYRESRFVPDVRNGNYYGLMQVNVKVHKFRLDKYGYTKDDMFDPEKNITVAADYLKDLYEMYGDDNPVVLGAYSGNWKAVNYYRATGIMCPYMTDVLTRAARYERIHGK